MTENELGKAFVDAYIVLNPLRLFVFLRSAGRKVDAGIQRDTGIFDDSNYL